MKNKQFSALALTFLCAFNTQLLTVHAQGTAFTYNGKLNDGANPATGIYDLRFTLCDAVTNGNSVGSLTNTATGITNGLFAVTLDFGGVFNGSNYWLELAARTNGGGAFSALSPRQQIMPTPYAIYSANAGSAVTAAMATSANSVSAANIAGTVQLAQLPGTILTNGSSGVNLTGTFSGNGAGVTNVSLQTANSAGAIAWSSIAGQTSFVLSSNYPVGQQPYSGVVFKNVDGRLDLATANLADSTLTVLTNNGSGGFGFSATLNTGSHPDSVTAADINGDGYLDLISANTGSGTLSLFTNNGTGGFGFLTSLNTGYYPYTATAVDVNGDGKMDLISSELYTFTVFINNGDGSFTSTTYNTPGEYLNSVAVADVNGDGKPDVILANIFDGGSGGMIVYTNNGSGGFVLSGTYSTSGYASPESVVAVDVNGDGKPDLVSANFGNGGPGALEVFINNGNGTFANPVIYPAGNGTISVTAFTNVDGNVDLACANRSDNTIVVFTNNGSGVFAPACTNILAGAAPQSVRAADVNGDGKVDLISCNISSNSVSVLFNTSTTAATNATFGGVFNGNGSGLTGLTATQLNGTLSLAQLPGAVVTNTETDVTLGGTFTGNGAGLTNLNVAQLPGTVLTNNQNGVALSGSFTGNGAGLTNLNVAQLPGTVLTNNQTGVTLSGTFNGNGAGLTNLIVAGTLPWQTVTGASQQAQSNTGYLVTNAAPVTIALPTSPNVGDIVSVSGVGSGGWQIFQNGSYSNNFLFSGSETNVTLNPGTYEITASGAQGGSGVDYGGGDGAEMEAQFNFATATNLTLMVGGSGGTGSGGGGGGGSFVVNGSTPLVIAGGGGGGGLYNGGGGGNTGSSGSSGSTSFFIAGAGGTAGNGGGGGVYAGGGGGFYNGGFYGDYSSGGGGSYLNGGTGGSAGGDYNGSVGGYGGGGGGDYYTAGGGGGYSGGGGGDYYSGGGGGGSFIASSATTVANLAGAQSGNGEVVIAQLPSFSGNQNSAIELQYVGNGQWQPVNIVGIITTASNTLGAVSVAQLPGAVVTNNETGVSLSGTFNGNGGGLTNLNVAGTLPWQTVTGTSQQAQSNTGYLITNAAPVTIGLPTSPNVGDIVSVSSAGSGGWQITQGNQYLFTGSEINITLNPGAYNITACGAQGGSGTEYSGGLGTEMEAQFNYATATNLTLMVGGSGGSGDGGGGGGGSFVVNGSTPLLIAGGGGGGGGYYGNGGSGNTGTNGSNGNSSGFGYAGSGGTAGNGGGGGNETYAGGGGGFYSGGTNGLYGSGGNGFLTGYAGGFYSDGAGGGYGGGGNGGYFTGGGGGGYSGGGCGDYYDGGGGGGSFIASFATTVTNLASVQSGNGEINIAQVYYTGGQGSAIELQYVGNGQWQPVSLTGTITTGANTLGAVSLAQLPGTVVTNNETGVNITGTFTGNGNGLTNVKASAIIGGANTNILIGGHTLFITNGIIMNVQ
jgi:hypothetical protein